MSRVMSVAGACVAALRVIERAEALGKGPFVLARGLALAVADAADEAQPSLQVPVLVQMAETLCAEANASRIDQDQEQADPTDLDVFSEAMKLLELGLRCTALLHTLGALANSDYTQRRDASRVVRSVLQADARGLRSAALFVESMPQVLEICTKGGKPITASDEAVITLVRFTGGVLAKEGAIATVSVLADASDEDFTEMLSGMLKHRTGAGGNAPMAVDVRGLMGVPC